MQRATKPEQRVGRHAAVIGTAAFVTTFSQIEVIGGLPIRYLTKNELHFTMEQMSLFMLLASVAWYLKPLVGLISDSIPIFGTRRRHYLMISSAVAGVCWIMLEIVPHSYYPFLLTATLLNVMIVFSSTVMGGLLVESAQAFTASGRFNSLRAGISLLATSIGFPAGGYLAGAAFGWTTVMASVPLFGLSTIVFWFLDEEPCCLSREKRWAVPGKRLSDLVHSKKLLSAAALLSLFFLAPRFATVLYYTQTDVLNFSQPFIGWQVVISGLAGALGAWIYSRTCRLVSLRLLLVIGIIFNGAGTLLFLFYRSKESAVIISAIGGVITTFGVLPLFDLMTRAAPAGGESMAYALMMSIRNLEVSVADWIGSQLVESLGWHFSSVVLVSGGYTLLVVGAVPFFYRQFLDRREIEPAKH